MAEHNDTGAWGEQIAVDRLTSLGYAIRERNWRMDKLELDIIAVKGRRMIFVEVKTRTSDRFADPIEAVNARKRSHMVKAADVYMRNVKEPYEWQFDIFIIIGTPADYTVDHIPDAFLPRLTRR